MSRLEAEYFLGYEDYDGTNKSLVPLIDFVKPLGRIQGFGPYGSGKGLVSLASFLPLPMIVAYLKKRPETARKIKMYTRPPGTWRK